jgi:predicted O-methyltransferase YrrM
VEGERAAFRSPAGRLGLVRFRKLLDWPLFNSGDPVAIRPVNWVKRRLILRNLSRSDSEPIRVIALALREALSERLTPEERRWVSEIEGRRRALTVRNDVIRVVDYGAGSPVSSRSAEEMSRGVEVTLPVAEMCEGASKRYRPCVVLFKLIRRTKPVSCLELGTALGVSGAYQGAALSLNGVGHLVSLEGSEALARIAEEGFRLLGLSRCAEVVIGRFEDTLRGILKKHRPVDYVFIDGHHDYEATLSYTEEILPFLAESAVLVYDDIAWSVGMRRAWRKIESDVRMAATLDMGSMGVCIVKRGLIKRPSVRFSMD